MSKYRKTKQGEWVIVGSPAEVRVGAVQVATRAGAVKTVIVSRIGRVFSSPQGEQQVYGYLSSKPTVRGECWSCRKHGNFDGCSVCGADGDC